MLINAATQAKYAIVPGAPTVMDTFSEIDDRNMFLSGTSLAKQAFGYSLQYQGMRNMFYGAKTLGVIPFGGGDPFTNSHLYNRYMTGRIGGFSGMALESLSAKANWLATGNDKTPAMIGRMLPGYDKSGNKMTAPINKKSIGALAHSGSLELKHMGMIERGIVGPGGMKFRLSSFGVKDGMDFSQKFTENLRSINMKQGGPPKWYNRAARKELKDMFYTAQRAHSSSVMGGGVRFLASYNINQFNDGGDYKRLWHSGAGTPGVRSAYQHKIQTEALKKTLTDTGLMPEGGMTGDNLKQIHQTSFSMTRKGIGLSVFRKAAKVATGLGTLAMVTDMVISNTKLPELMNRATQSIGAMFNPEFGGEVLNNSRISSERQKQMQAIANAGINARGLLGNEAQNMHNR